MHRKWILLITIAFCLSCFASAAAALTVEYEVLPSELEAYFDEHPEIQVSGAGASHSESEMIQNALTRSDETDVYLLHTAMSTVYEQLRDRGYFLQIEDSELLEMVGGIYPEILGEVTCDGKLCALPFAFIGQSTIGVSMESWETLEFGEEELPGTWEELMHFAVERWPEFSGNANGIRLFSERDPYSLLQSIENQYEAYRRKNGYAFGYDTPEFREILNLFQEYVQSDEVRMYANGEEDSTWTYLFDTSYAPDVQDDHMDVRLLKLAFKEGGATYVPIGLEVMAINPNSKHVDEVIELAKYLYRNLNPVEELKLYPDENEPIMSELYDSTLKEYEQRMQSYQARLSACADEAERKAIQLEMDAYDQETQTFLSEYKYSASPESIQQYREEVEGALVPYYATTLSSEEYNAVNEKRERFLKGEISADQYIDELERRFVNSVREG